MKYESSGLKLLISSKTLETGTAVMDNITSQFVDPSKDAFFRYSSEDATWPAANMWPMTPDDEHAVVMGRRIIDNEKEVAADQAALDMATSIREQDLAEFNGKEKDLLGATPALKAALTALSSGVQR